MIAHGAHDHAEDPRNAAILNNVDGELVPRHRAVVSVFDAGFVLGDGVWEGLRVSGGHPAFLDQHLDRLYEGAAALLLDVGRSRAELTEEIYRTLDANEMRDGVHIRLMVTRGPKSTPCQDPRMSAGPATLVIIAEHKEPLPATVENGLSLFTVHVRRSSPDTLDPKLNTHSKLNDITACIQAYTAGADELGGAVPVVDAADFLRAPEAYLRWLCDVAGVGFTDRMLRWPAGPRDSDGVWAPHWYDAVLASTGFQPYRPRRVDLTGPARAAADRSRPFYERLHEARVTAP